MTHSLFFAYPGNPAHIGETIKALAEEVNQNILFNIYTWREIDNVGLKIVPKILKAIDDADVFCCDLTYLNNNVLYELGYAIGRGKKVWISLNNSIIESGADYYALSTLSTVGYNPYRNKHELRDNLYASAPWNNVEDTLSSGVYDEEIEVGKKPLILYVKSSIPTDASSELSSLLHKSRFEIRVDDPDETPPDTLKWYYNSLQSASGVVLHFLSDTHKGHLNHNFKVSFIAGLAAGLSIPSLLLAHSPFLVPLDNKDSVRVHDTAGQCRSWANFWLGGISELGIEIALKKENLRRRNEKARRLARIKVGQIVAENEEENLEKYFLKTSAFDEIIDGDQTIYVGRKGTGKTANLYSAESYFGRDKRNVVCVIKPVGYEVEGLLRLLSIDMPKSEKGYLIESMWKLLIYTEIAENIMRKIDNMSDSMLDDNQKALRDFCNTNAQIMRSDFSIRFNEAVLSLVDISTNTTPRELRDSINVRLHLILMSRLKKLLAPILVKRNKIVVLVDNLDKAWGDAKDSVALSEIFFGLLGIARRFSDEMNYIKEAGGKVDFKLAIFIRSDIFNYIYREARERDKLDVAKIAWNDSELLSRVLDLRLAFASEEDDVEEVWKTIFVDSIEGMSIKDYIIHYSLPRPRDVIQFLKISLGEAVNRGHEIVERKDLESAKTQYSRWVYASILVEDDPNYNLLEKILYEFFGGQIEYKLEEVMALLMKVTSSSVISEHYLNIMCDLSFLEIEYRNNDYKIASDEEERDRLITSAKRRAETEGRDFHLRVNAPFREWLSSE